MAQREYFEKDYYKVLGVDSKASKDDIKRAYRKLAQQFHPDANEGDAGAEARFKEVSEAHAVLSNDDKRREYDEIRSYGDAGGGFYGFRPGGGRGNVRVDIGDLFGEDADIGSIFGDAFGFTTRPRRGRDLETEVSISFDDAVAGTTITLPQGGKARIPAGVRDGARIKVAGKGEALSGASGDLYVTVHVGEHPIFRLTGSGNVALTLPVTIAEAALGAKVEVPTLDGPVTVKIPVGTQSGKTLRVKGKGVARAGHTGDLLVTVSVEVPQKLNKAEKEALEAFARLHTVSPRSHLEDFIRRSGQRAS